MEIVVNDKQKLLSEAAVNRAQLRVSASFAKFSDNVKSVTITVEDVNGPKGGVDKECRVLVRLKKLKDVVIKTNNESISKSIPGAIDRAARSVGRLLDRRMQIAKSSRVGAKA